MKILVIHYDKLIKRKKHILLQLSKYNLECEFVSNYGKDTLTNEERKRFKKLNDSEISLSLHHIECYKRVTEQQEYDYAIILEDDVILKDNFRNILEKYIRDLPEDWDMLFFGEGHGVHIPIHNIRENVHIYKKSVDLKNMCGEVDGSTRCADSYIISKKCCKKILERINLPNYIITMPIDHLLNYINYYNNFNIYWSEPTITIQGTSTGMFKSSLR